MPHDARDIANFLLDHADSRGVPVTIMSLLKMIYLAHGWHLARYGRPLVKNAFEAWQHGPVVRAVYECFQDAGDKPIKTRATKFDPRTATRAPMDYALAQDEERFLKQIFDAYSHFHAFQLSDLTHEPGSPWDQLWNNVTGSTNPGMRISDEDIRAHFMRRHYLQREH
jgi:uncharacterized phage-associated protein